MAKSLFLCSRMDPFRDKGLRTSLARAYGPASVKTGAYHLIVENNKLPPGGDARPPCARALQSSDAVLLLLDGTPSTLRDPKDAPVLELEVMLAAVGAKPILVLDASGGQDPLLHLLGAEFFAGGGAQRPLMKVVQAGAETKLADQAARMIGEICVGDPKAWGSLSQGHGWERLYHQRPDRTDEFADDGGNFPFSTSSLKGAPDMGISDIDHHLSLAETMYRSDQFGAMVHAWDAIRALSLRPWASTTLDAETGLRWLRALKVWGGAMSWLGLFGHSSAAAMMATHAGLRLAHTVKHKETALSGTFAADRHHGGLASAYFSLSRLAPSAVVAAASRAKGIRHANDGLALAKDKRSIAGLLVVRGALRLSAGARGLHGMLDLHASERMHLRAAEGKAHDAGVAAARVQLGAAYKEIAKRTGRSRFVLGIAEGRLREAHEALVTAEDAGGEDSNPGQLLMCMKHLIQTYQMQGRDTAALDMWLAALKRSEDAGLTDQHRQLREIGRDAGWQAPKSTTDLPKAEVETESESASDSPTRK